jgi:hypothetical protein
MIRDGKRSACPTKFVLRAKSRIVGRALRLPVPGGTSWGALSREIMYARQISHREMVAGHPERSFASFSVFSG